MYLCTACPGFFFFFFTAALSDVNKNIMLVEFLIRRHTGMESFCGIALRVRF